MKVTWFLWLNLVLTWASSSSKLLHTKVLSSTLPVGQLMALSGAKLQGHPSFVAQSVSMCIRFNTALQRQGGSSVSQKVHIFTFDTGDDKNTVLGSKFPAYYFHFGHPVESGSYW